MKKNVFEQIQEKIATVSIDAAESFQKTITPHYGAELYRMGFTSSVSVVQSVKDLNHTEILRAQLIRYFGCKVLHDDEIKKLEANYKLMTASASRFMDVIPAVNQKDIVDFVERVKKDRLNQGRIETDLYHVPITSEFRVTAPPSLFRKAQNWDEMTEAERIKWLEEDPIVWKKLFRFDPNRETNEATKWNLMVTAWGMESVLLNTN